jgi:S-phase kinase-associated protein 1
MSAEMRNLTFGAPPVPSFGTLGDEQGMLTLISSDRVSFKNPKRLIVNGLTDLHGKTLGLKLIQNFLEDVDSDTISVPNVNSKTLANVIEFLKLAPFAEINEAAKEKDEAAERGNATAEEAFLRTAIEHLEDEEVKDMQKEFLRGLSQSELFDLLVASNYLNYGYLCEAACQFVADMIKGKTPEQIRQTFNIKNDFTKEEEDEVKRENSWAYQGDVADQPPTGGAGPA